MIILVSHVGFDTASPKHAILRAARSEAHPREPARFRVVEASSGRPALEGRAEFRGEVARWKSWVFWRLQFSALSRPGRYAVQLPPPGPRAGGCGQELRSRTFEVAESLLLRRTVPAVLQYFRSQRCGGVWDRADRHAPFHGGRPDRVDVHGGWYDASGDKSKYLSHLSYANSMNPQQSPLVVWAMLEARDLLAGSGHEGLRRKLLREARYGASFLARMQDREGYFYPCVFDRWTKLPQERLICAFRGAEGIRSDRYRAGYRQGGGMAIAALARAAASGGAGKGRRPGRSRCRGRRTDWLAAAVRGFEHLEAHNLIYLDDGRENIIDDYCALLAAAELWAAAGQERFLQAARRRARALEARLCSDRRYSGFWRVGETGEEPFFHAAEAGLPAIALLRYAQTEPQEGQAEAAVAAVRRSLDFELALTAEVANPFGYARQYVKPEGAPPRSAFFFPHENPSGYWWQGENARLASLAAAASLARRLPEFAGQRRGGLERYAADQLSWILGANPYDACMLHGFGSNNPEYEARHPNGFGGICNGITGGVKEEEEIDFLPFPHARQGKHRWRWAEQWLPHAAWYLLAVCAAS